MKAMTVAAWKWILVAALVVGIGAMLAVGLGRKRGTRAYRWRMAMWTLALSLIGGVGLISMGTTMSGCDETSSKNSNNGDVSGKDDASGEAFVTCYQDSWREPDLPVMCYKEVPQLDVQDAASTDWMVTCYAPRPPDVEVAPQPDIQVTCYDPIPVDVKQDTSAVTPDVGPTCYLVAIDVQPQQDVEQPEAIQPTCYAPLPPDAQ